MECILLEIVWHQKTITANKLKSYIQPILEVFTGKNLILYSRCICNSCTCTFINRHFKQTGRVE